MFKRATRLRSQLACLGEASRFRLVRVLQARSRYVTELASEVGLSQSCTTRHLQALKRCGLVCAERRGKRVMYSLCSEDPGAVSLLGWALADRSQPDQVPERRVTASSRSRAAQRVTPGAVGTASDGRRKPVVEEASDPISVPTPDRMPDAVEGGAEGGREPDSDEAGADTRNPRRRGDLEDFLL